MSVTQLEAGLPISISSGDEVFRPDVLLTEAEIQARVAEMGGELADHYAERGEVHVLTVLSGAMLFAADLRRSIQRANPALSMTSSEISLASYGVGTRSSGIMRHLGGTLECVTGRHVLIAEDVIDTGLTLGWLTGYIGDYDPASVEVASAFQKMETERMADVLGDLAVHTGFSVGQDFIIGYGLDLGGEHRDLADVYRLTRIPSELNDVQS